MRDRQLLPSEITSYDLLKTFAVVVMVIDHVGAYFFPDIEAFRAVGRLCVPAWFFLIGYARGRDIPLAMALGAVILLIGNIVTGSWVFPLSILPTMILIRLSLDQVVALMLKNVTWFWGASFVLALLIVPTSFIIDYGAQGFLLALLGYFVRHKADDLRLRKFDKKIIRSYFIFSIIVFISTQQLLSGFSLLALSFLVFGVVFIHYVLWHFKPYNFGALTDILPCFVVWFIQLCGRHSLGIYVIHLLIFMTCAAWLGMHGDGWLHWKWFVI